MPAPRINWYDNRVKLEIANATARMIDAIAFQIEGTAKVNITNNGQVDTGFMRNSVYAITASRNTFNDIDANGEYVSSKTRQTVQRAAEPNPPDPPKGGAIVGVAAEYAVYQEMRQSFLFDAVEQVAQSVDSVISGIKIK